MNLPALWFILIGVLFVGYFFLEGFDYGVGMLLPFVGRTDDERRAVLATIGPVWDANEVWLITAGGAIFSAFPNWYATLFSGFYLALALLITALILRGVALEFRTKDDGKWWRSLWDFVIWLGSTIPGFVWGVAMGNILHGMPINGHMDYIGGFFTLLNPYALAGGCATGLLFVLHGALYLSLKTPSPLRERSMRIARKMSRLTMVAYFGFVVLSYFFADFVNTFGIDPGPVPLLAGSSMVAVGFLLRSGLLGWAFAMTALTIFLSTMSVFLALYPRVIISRLNPAWDLTVYNAASNHYSLTVMSIVAISALPFVLAYQIWTYWIFRKRVSLHETFHY